MIFPSNANRKLLVRNVKVSTCKPRDPVSQAVHTHTPSAGSKFSGFCEIMHLKTFSKLEYVSIGQGKTSLLLTATQSLDSLPDPSAILGGLAGRALDQVFVIFCF